MKVNMIHQVKHSILFPSKKFEFFEYVNNKIPGNITKKACDWPVCVVAVCSGSLCFKLKMNKK